MQNSCAVLDRTSGELVAASLSRAFLGRVIGCVVSNVVFQDVSKGRSVARTLAFPLGAAMLAAIAVVLAGVHPRLVDDTFITFQYARNLVEHGALTWHVDLPRVDGFTSLGHVLLLAAGTALGLDIVLANTLIVFGAMALIMLIFVWRTEDLPPAARLLGLSTICLNAGLLFWIAGGLDAVPYVASFFLAYDLYERALQDGRFGARTALGLTVLAGMRPEGMLISIALAAHFLTMAARLRRPLAHSDLAWLAAVPGIVAAMTAWRMAQYGHPLPNTFYAKASASSLLEIRNGAAYFGDWILWKGGAAVLATPLALALGARNGLRALFVLGQCAVVIVEGGDTHPEARFLLPLVPLIALDLAWLSARSRHLAALGAVLALAAALPSAGRVLHADVGAVRIAEGDWPFATIDDDPVAAARAVAARRIAGLVMPNEPVVATDVGVLAYASELPIVDAFGLNDAALAALPKPEGQPNTWGINRLDVLADEGATIAFLWFAEPEPWGWQDIAEGRTSCASIRTQVRAARMSVAPDVLARDFLCASAPFDESAGLHLNFLVRADAVEEVLRDPSSVELSACVTAFRAACGYE